MQRKELIVRQTAMGIALIAAARDFMAKNPNTPLSAAISNWQPKRSLKREPTWTVSRKGN